MKRRTSRYSSCYENLRMELKNRADLLRRKYAPPGPPYDVLSIADGMGVDVEFASLKGIDGYVETMERNYRAVISTESIEARQRFTLGHELCHVLLMRRAEEGTPVPLVRYRSNGSLPGLHQDPIEESLCNFFAGELLAPTHEIDVRINQQAVTPQTILNIAADYKISMQAAAVKATQVLGSRRTACSLWNLQTLWPVPVWWAGLETTCRIELERLECLVSEKAELRDCWDSYNGKNKSVRIQVAPTQELKYALVLIKYDG